MWCESFESPNGGPARMVRRPRIAGGGESGPLHCWMETGAEAVVVHVEGDVDLATAPILANAIAAGFLWAPKVIVDFAGVTYIDGSGLGVLRRAAEHNAARLAVAAPSPRVRMLFDLVGLTGAVPLAASVDGARAYLNTTGGRESPGVGFPRTREN